MKTPYFSKVIEIVPRILSMQDRDTASPTYGCFDRRYWAWRYKDFPDMSLQYSLLPLLHLWQSHRDDNIYFQNERVFDWIQAGLLFLTSHQNKNGSFNQCYPHENTPGVVYDVLPVLLRSIGSDYEPLLTPALKHAIEVTIEKAVRFVLRTDERHALVANHLAHYADTLFDVAAVFPSDAVKTRMWHYIERLVRSQSPSGWFPEYEGFDAGYECCTISYLSSFYCKTKEAKIFDMLKTCIDHLSYFVHPDGTIGGAYTSRHCEVIYPAGFERLKQYMPMAETMSQFIYRSISHGKTVTINALDEDNLIRVAQNYLEADSLHLNGEIEQKGRLPFNDEFERFFSDSLIYVCSTPRYYLILNGKKGGCIAIFDKLRQELAMEDRGYIALTKQKTWLTTHAIQKNSCIIRKENSTFVIETCFSPQRKELLNSFTLILLRCFNMTLGQIQIMGDFFRKLVARRLFESHPFVQLQLTRTVAVGRDEIKIEDRIKNFGLEIQKLCRSPSLFVNMQMASAGYFQTQQLYTSSWESKDVRKGHENGNEVILSSVHRFLHSVEEEERVSL